MLVETPHFTFLFAGLTYSAAQEAFAASPAAATGAEARKLRRSICISLPFLRRALIFSHPFNRWSRANFAGKVAVGLDLRDFKLSMTRYLSYIVTGFARFLSRARNRSKTIDGRIRLISGSVQRSRYVQLDTCIT